MFESKTVVVIVPLLIPPLLCREQLSTSMSRAREHLVLVRSEDTISIAIMSMFNRALGRALLFRRIQ